jgi:lipoate-protein ligase A
MAVDEAILESTGSRQTPPTLRLYAWQPPCLSLGYAQSASEVDFAALQRLGWQIVRRPTGGRAILHTDELTYSVITPPDDPIMAGSILESYQHIAQALLHALNILGLQATADAQYPNGTAANGPVCFEVPSKYEITVMGKKLLGSAQARRSQGILQHGSFPLHGDLTRITQALVFQDENARQQAAKRLLAHAATAADHLAPPPTWQQAAQAFQSAFAQVLELDLIPGELTSTELERAQTLQTEKYATDSWTMRL